MSKKLLAVAVVLGALAVSSFIPGFQVKVIETSAKADCGAQGC